MGQEAEQAAQDGQAARSAQEAAGQSVRHEVDKSGNIYETVLNEDGEVVSEELVGNVAELAIEKEYVDEGGHVVSRARDESGNVFEQIHDYEGNMVGRQGRSRRAKERDFRIGEDAEKQRLRRSSENGAGRGNVKRDPINWG